MADYCIAASLLSADFARLGEEASQVIKAGADWIHLDVMDNHYVPNLTVGPMVCQALRDYGITAPIDVHLMVKPVDRLIEAFAKAQATYICFHPEASQHVDRSLTLIKELGCKAGLALNPATPIDYLDYVMDKLDMILLMSVNPGFGGQNFISSSLDKIQTVAQKIQQQKRPIRLEVDGGIKANNLKAIAQAGADTFVIGSGIFQSKDYPSTLKNLRQQLI